MLQKLQIGASKIAISRDGKSGHGIPINIVKLRSFNYQSHRLQKFTVRDPGFDVDMACVAIEFKEFSFVGIATKSVENGCANSQILVKGSQVLRLDKQLVPLIGLFFLNKSRRRQKGVVTLVQKGRVLIVCVDHINGH